MIARWAHIALFVVFMASSAICTRLRAADPPHAVISPTRSVADGLPAIHGAAGQRQSPLLLQEHARNWWGSDSGLPPVENPLKVSPHTVQSFVRSNQANKPDPASSMCSMCLRIANLQLQTDDQNTGLYCKGLDGPGQQESVRLVALCLAAASEARRNGFAPTPIATLLRQRQICMCIHSQACSA